MRSQWSKEDSETSSGIEPRICEGKFLHCACTATWQKSFLCFSCRWEIWGPSPTAFLTSHANNCEKAMRLPMSSTCFAMLRHASHASPCFACFAMLRTSNLLRVSTLALSALSGWSWGGRKRPVQFSGPGTFWAMP